jgi:hypothetical protein
MQKINYLPQTLKGVIDFLLSLYGAIEEPQRSGARRSQNEEMHYA